MAEVHLLINTPEKTVADSDAKIVELPGVVGRFEVLPGHAPLITALSKGQVRFVTPDGKEQKVEIASGFVEVIDNKVTVCAEIE